MFFICSMSRFTKAILLRSSIAFALRSVRLWSQKLKLTEEERYDIADRTIAEMRRHGSWRDLDDELEIPVGHGTPRT